MTTFEITADDSYQFEIVVTATAQADSAKLGPMASERARLDVAEKLNDAIQELAANGVHIEVGCHNGPAKYSLDRFRPYHLKTDKDKPEPKAPQHDGGFPTHS